MSTTILRGRNVVFALVTVVVLAGVAFGVNYLWQRQFGPTPASADDCRLAQELFDQARKMPSDPDAAEEWEVQLRQIRYSQFENEGLSTQVGRYVYWMRVQATGEGERPTAAEITLMEEEATGHCRGTDVELTIAEIGF